MAEMIFQQRVEEKLADAAERQVDDVFHASSAGTAAAEGDPAADAALRTLRHHGVRLKNHASSLFDERHVDADLILTMTVRHKAHLLMAYPELAGKIFTLQEFAAENGEDAGPMDISDPFMQGDEAYLKAFDQIDAAVTAVLKRLFDDEKAERSSE